MIYSEHNRTKEQVETEISQTEEMIEMLDETDQPSGFYVDKLRDLLDELETLD